MEPRHIAEIADHLTRSSGDWGTVGHDGHAVVVRRGPFVAKWHARDGWIERETTALRLINERAPGLVPDLFASAEGVIVKENLGDGPTLADALLGDDADNAAAYVLAWADAVAHLHESTWLNGLEVFLQRSVRS